MRVAIKAAFLQMTGAVQETMAIKEKVLLVNSSLVGVVKTDLTSYIRVAN